MDRRTELLSPNGKISIILDVDKRLKFYLRKQTKDVLKDVELVIKADDFTPSLWIVKNIIQHRINEKWKPVWGKNETITEHCNEYKIMLSHEDDNYLSMSLLFRLYNDGIAYRILWHGSDKVINITQEKANIEFNANTMCWYSNDGEDEQTMNNGGMLLSDFQYGNTPMVIKNDDCYIAIHEAHVNGYEVAKAIRGEINNQITLTSASVADLPHMSPWRIIIIGETPTALIESTIIENLNRTSNIKDTSWIKPGKCMWDWRNHGAKTKDFTYGLNNESMIRYIDFASENNFQYVLIDGGWYGNPNNIDSDPIKPINTIDIDYLVGYATKKNIGFWIYLDDLALKYYDMDRTFLMYKKWGVVGIKHGFIKNKGQDRVAFTREVVQKCADYELMYVPHEPTRPWGLHIEYPNYLSCEFINAQFDGPNRAAANPTQLCIIPFTNNLTAPLDRACGMFDLNSAIDRDRIHREPVTTIASQLAQCLIIHTGFLCVPDHPHSYNSKRDLFEFIKQLPPMNWDKTRVINGEIGEFVTIARKYKEEWFVGSLTNELKRSINISLDFLEEDEYLMTVYSDGDNAHYLHNREEYKIYSKEVKRSDNIELKLAPGGGCALWIRKKASRTLEGKE